MKKKFGVMTIAALFLAISMIGSSLAYFRAESETTNEVSAGNLGVELRLNNDAVSKQTSLGINAEGAVPGSTYDYPLQAYNSGDYDSYIRITLTRFWQNQDGEKNFDADASKIEFVMPNSNDWIIDDSDVNKEVVYLYYKYPVSSHTSTTNAINAIKIGQMANSDRVTYASLEAKVDVEVDAIQKVAAKDAILAEWGLDVTFADDGTLINVE